MRRSTGTDNTTILRGTRVRGVPRDMQRAHYLAVIAGAKAGQRIRIGNQPLIIGRAEPADWILPDDEISRSHCRVTLALDQVIVEDLDSSNGTFLEGRRVTEAKNVPVGARLQIGTHVIEHQWLTRKEVEDFQAMTHDTQKASEYLRSLLPAPLREGPVTCEWAHEPSPRLGGDVFGYRVLNERHYAIYLVDVSGHGASAAMHAVSVLNLLARSVLPVTDFARPSSVLQALNVMFDAKHHSGLSAMVWYGVYDPQTRRLAYATAGHHPAFLVDAKREEAVPLETAGPELGVKDGAEFATETVEVPPKSMLYVFSDGAFEFETRDEDVWGLDNFISVLLESPAAGKSEPQRLLAEVKQRSISDKLEDDFALMAFRFG